LGDESAAALIVELQGRINEGEVDNEKITSEFWQHMEPDEDDIKDFAEKNGFYKPVETEPDDTTPEIIRQLSRVVYGADQFSASVFRELLRELRIYSQHA